MEVPGQMQRCHVFFAGGFNGSAVSSSKLGFLGGLGFSKVLTGRGLRAFRGLWLEALVGSSAWFLAACSLIFQNYQTLIES